MLARRPRGGSVVILIPRCHHQPPSPSATISGVHSFLTKDKLHDIPTYHNDSDKCYPPPDDLVLHTNADPTCRMVMGKLGCGEDESHSRKRWWGVPSM
jgi:hypothetical protein